MFHAERLLGSLLNAALSRGLKVGHERKGPRRAGIKGLAGDLLSQNKAAIGLGLLGVAIAAYEHFSQNTQSSAGSSSAPLGPVAPMPKPSGNQPPPVPNWSPPPLPIPPGDQKAANLKSDTAAHADHSIDEQERQKILKRIEEGGCSPEEREFLSKEEENPLDLNSLFDLVKSPQLAEQVYVVSLMAIQPCSDAELGYLQQLAQGLGLEEGVVSKWNKEFEVRQP